MSFFAIQVRGGQEIEAKEMLKSVFKALDDIQVETIYALETFTHVLKKNLAQNELSECLDENDIADYLHAKRTRENLSNLRAAYAGIPADDCLELNNLRNSYQDEISQQSDDLKKRKSSKKIRTVLPGYILLELKDNLFELPKQIWQMVKSVPKVTGIVSPYSIPEEEMEQFFDQIDLTPTVEVYVSDEEQNSEGISISGEAKNPAHESRNLQVFDSEPLEYLEEDLQEKTCVQKMIERCRLFLRGKEQIIGVPLPFFKQLKHQEFIFKEQMNKKADIFLYLARMMRLEVSG